MVVVFRVSWMLLMMMELVWLLSKGLMVVLISK